MNINIEGTVNLLDLATACKPEAVYLRQLRGRLR